MIYGYNCKKEKSSFFRSIDQFLSMQYYALCTSSFQDVVIVRLIISILIINVPYISNLYFISIDNIDNIDIKLIKPTKHNL